MPERKPMMSRSQITRYTDPKQLTQECGGFDRDEWPLVVGHELGDNGTDAAEERGTSPVISVETWYRAKDKRLRIAVTDNGGRMPDDKLVAVFDPRLFTSSKHELVTGPKSCRPTSYELKLSLGTEPGAC